MTIPRSSHAHRIALAALASFATIACDLGAPGLGTAYLSAELIAADGSDARGHLTATLSPWLHQIRVGVRHLDPVTTYEITADDVTVATLTTDPIGAAKVDLSPDALSLDPREHVFAVRAPGGANVLVMSDPNASSGATSLGEHSPLASLLGGSAASTFIVLPTGVRRFWVEIGGVAPGEYALWIDGTPRATIDATSGAGIAIFSSAPGPDELLLDFDPRLATIEILLGDAYAFAGSGRAEILGIDVCPRSTRAQALIAASAGGGRASLATRSDCGRKFGVVITDVPMGDYELVVGGVVRGEIVVGEDENGASEGRLEFATNAGEGARVLSFDPRGKSIEVRQSDRVLFSLDAFGP